MPTCQTCLRLKLSCSREKRPGQSKCMRCVRRQSSCIVDKPNRTDSGVRKSAPLQHAAIRNVESMTTRTSRQEEASQADSETKRILIALDPGSAATKASFKLVKRGEAQKPRVGVDVITPGIIDIIWQNFDQSVPTQLAFKYSEDTGVFETLWGEGVDQAIRDQTIRRDEVFRSLKPSLFCTDDDDKDSEQLPSPRRRIEEQIAGLPECIQFSATDESNPNNRRQLTYIDIYSEFIRHAWYWILRRVQEEAGQLPWPQLDGYGIPSGFNPADSVQIECVIPMPAGSTPASVDLVVNAARKAGLPSPYIVAEPAAAYAYDLQKSVEAHGAARRGGLQLVVDCGGGSVDLQMWYVMSVAPMKIKEAVQGVDSWCGGSFVNRKCRNLIREALEPFMSHILKEMSEAREQDISEQQFLDEVEAQFEEQKRKFVGFGRNHAENTVLSEQPRNTVLQIPNLPQLPGTCAKRGRLILSELDMRKIFNPSFSEIKKMIDGMIDRYHAAAARENALIEGVREILLVGGGSASPHLRERLRREYYTQEGRTSGYPIIVRMPNKSATGSSSWIAGGALLLLIDRAFLKERLLRRGFCVVLDEPCTAPEMHDPQFDVSKDPHDGVWRRRDVSRFIFCINELVAFECRRRGPEGCWRADWVDGPHQLREDVYFCEDPEIGDGVWVHGEKGKETLTPCGYICFSLSKEDTQFFEVRQSPKKRRYYYIEYRMEFFIKGIEMTYEVVIPRDGMFNGRGQLGAQGGYIRKRGELINITAATAMSNVAE